MIVEARGIATIITLVIIGLLGLVAIYTALARIRSVANNILGEMRSYNKMSLSLLSELRHFKNADTDLDLDIDGESSGSAEIKNDRPPIIVRGADPEWRNRIERKPDYVLATHMKDMQRPTREQMIDLMARADRHGVTADEIVALGVETGVLHQSRVGADVQSLSHDEVDSLFDVTRAWQTARRTR